MALRDKVLGFKFISTGGWARRAEGTQGQDGYKAPDLTADEKSSGDIIFIEPLKQIYVGGTYFGVTEEQASTLIELNTKVGALENKVGTTEALSSTLLVIANDLKSKLDGGNYLSGAQGIQGTTIAVTKTVDEQQVAVTNVVEAVNELFTRLTSLGGDDYTINFGTQGAQGIQTVMNNVGTAVSTAQSTADGKIAKHADTTAKTISGATPSDLVDADAIATAIETACERLLKDSSNQDQTNWGNESKKTLTTLRNLIAEQQTIITGHQSTLENTVGSDWESIKNSITAIKNELGGTEGAEGTEPRNLVGSFLDAVATILPTKNNNTYTFTVGESSNTATSIQGAIDKIVTLINTASSAGVTQITEGAGIQASNSGVGNVTVSANADAKLTGTIGSVGDTYGLKGTQGTTNTVQNALTGLNNEVISASTAATNAVTAAAGAQSAAESALTQLKWVVV